MIKKLDHLVITTARLADCLAFYEALGFMARQDGARWTLFAGDFKLNVHLLGQELLPQAQAVHCGSADLCFEVEGSLAAHYEALLQKGLTPLTALVSRRGVRGAMQSFYLRDPDGNLLELCSYETT